jgi:hypothetical protein
MNDIKNKFNEYLKDTNNEYSSSLNPWDLFKAGYESALKQEPIVNEIDEFFFQGRIGICEPVNMGQYNQYRMSGVLIALDQQPLLSKSEDFECIQCEIKIKPIQRLGVSKLKGARLDHIALQLGNDEAWETNKQ